MLLVHFKSYFLKKICSLFNINFNITLLDQIKKFVILVKACMTIVENPKGETCSWIICKVHICTYKF